MKRVSIAKASRTLAQYTSELNGEIVVVTQGNRPVAALVPLTSGDRESLALSTHPEFLKLIRRSRAEAAAGKTTSLPEMRTKVLGRAGSKRSRRPVPKRRGHRRRPRLPTRKRRQRDDA
jgi:antitoxin (DNA-binding transcriptional repressor) of toxin-antitoxin stability system